jgi:hypothetical protein
MSIVPACAARSAAVLSGGFQSLRVFAGSVCAIEHTQRAAALGADAEDGSGDHLDRAARPAARQGGDEGSAAGLSGRTHRFTVANYALQHVFLFATARLDECAVD